MERPPSALSVALVGKREIQSLNSRYRGKDYATDVLSFSYPGTIMEDLFFLGEIVLAPEIAAEQAIQYRTTLDKELRKLLLHGILHLLGYDHESDKGQMTRIQTMLIRRKFFSEGLRLANLKAKQ